MPDILEQRIGNPCGLDLIRHTIEHGHIIETSRKAEPDKILQEWTKVFNQTLGGRIAEELSSACEMANAFRLSQIVIFQLVGGRPLFNGSFALTLED